MTLKFNRVLEVVEDFDREHLWNGSSNRQVENGVIINNFFHIRKKQFRELWSINKNDLDLWLWTTEIGSCGCQGTRLCKISPGWVQRFMSCHANKLFSLSHNGEKSENPVWWPWPWNSLGFKLSAAVKELSCARGKKTQTKAIQSVATTWAVITYMVNIKFLIMLIKVWCYWLTIEADGRAWILVWPRQMKTSFRFAYISICTDGK